MAARALAVALIAVAAGCGGDPEPVSQNVVAEADVIAALLERIRPCAAERRASRLAARVGGDVGDRLAELEEDIACPPTGDYIGAIFVGAKAWKLADTLRKRSPTPDDLRVAESAVDGKDDGLTTWRIALGHAHERVDVEGPYDLLNSGQLALLALFAVEAEVLNGGFEQFFYNSTGALVHEAAAGARVVGAPAYASLLQDATAVFPGGLVPDDRETRIRLLEGIPDDELAALDDRFVRLEDEQPLEDVCARYIAANREVFYVR